MDGLFEEYTFLKSHLPMHCAARHNKILSEIDSLRQKILISQRNRVIADFEVLYIRKSSLLQGKLESILNIEPVTRNSVGPKISQNSTFLIYYIHKNLIKFANAVLNFKNNKDFNHLIEICVPAVFANFCCAEDIPDGNAFYQCILKEARPFLAIKILTPLFRSILGFPFVRNVMDKFIPQFISEKRLLDKHHMS